MPFCSASNSAEAPQSCIGCSILHIPDELSTALCCCAGYEHNVEGVMEDLLNALDDPELPLLLWTEAFANVEVWSLAEAGPLLHS